METTKRALILAFLCLLIASCKKEETIEPGITTREYTLSEFFEASQPPLQTFQISADSGDTIMGATHKTIIRFYPQSFVTSSGQIVTGQITVELREILTANDMVLSKITTTSNGQLLVSAGQIYLRAFLGTEELHVNPASRPDVTIRTHNGISPPPMNVFYGQVTTSDSIIGDWSINWVIADTLNTPMQISSFPGPARPAYFYNFPIDSFNYINCDHFYQAGSQLSDITVILPEQYKDSNSAVQIIIPSINSVAACRSSASTQFHGTIPVGLDVQIVIISKIDDQYYYEIIPTTITKNLVINSNPQSATLSQIQTAIRNL
jgi:hypothetical protein